MKIEMRFRPEDDVRLVWLVALGVLLAGSFFVQTRYQTAIAASHDRTETLYRRTVADARILQQAASLRAIQERAEADLARVSHDSSLSDTTAKVLSLLHGSANAFRTQVLQVQPVEEAAPSGGTVKDDALSAKMLQATALTIRVRGTFRDILHFIEDLPHHATLLNVSDTEMAIATDSGNTAPEPRLEATIHAVMYRLSMPEKKEFAIAPSR